MLLGVRAGVGTSTLAAHLSVLAQQTRALAQGDAVQQDGLLMELAQPAGDLALYLNLDSRFHYEDALRNASRIDATLARTAMARHDSGLVLLDRAGGSDAVPPSDPGALLQRLRGVFASVLCDAGGCCGSCRRCCWTRQTRSGWSPMRRSPRWSRWTRH